MTLIVNEIHLLDGLQDTMLVAAADRRVSKRDGSYHSTRRKLFSIPYLRGTISYFGLAAVYPRGRESYLSDWLPSFINRHASASNLQVFSESLWQELNTIVPARVLRNSPSGFHIMGYTANGYPDFWFLSNIGGLEQFRYVDLRSEYAPPSSHFLGRDAQSEWGWDGVSPKLAKNGIHTYRNGDFKAHAVAWDLLDGIYLRLLQFPDFRPPRTPAEYAEYIKVKFEVISYIYSKLADKKIIARPIDVLVLTSD